MSPIGVGFLGAGPVTQAIHLPAIAILGDRFRAVRVMDVGPVIAFAVADRYGAIGSTDAASVLEDPLVDVVAICSPNAFHAKQVVAACQAGKRAVLCEKPLAVTREEAAQIRVAAGQSGTAIFVGTMHAYDPAYLAARAAWRSSGDVAVQVRNAILLPGNDVFTDQATELVPSPLTQGFPGSLDLATKKAMMRGAMLGLAIHDIPLVRDFQADMGELKLARFLPPFGYALVSQAGGSTTELTGLMPGHWPPKWTFEVIGRTHSLRAEMPPSYVMAGSARVEVSGPDGRQVFQSSENGYQALWRAIEAAVHGAAPPPITLDTAIDDLGFALDLADSAERLLEEAA